MSKKQNLIFEKYLKKIIDQYIPILFLQQYQIDVEYKSLHPNTFFQCGFNYPYLNTTIYYGDTALNDFKKKENLVPIIVHELCHIITDPLYCKATNRYTTSDEINDEREKLTDYIANIVIKNNL